MFKTNDDGTTNYYVDGELRAIIAAEHLAEFKTNIGIVEPPAFRPFTIPTN